MKRPSSVTRALKNIIRQSNIESFLLGGDIWNIA